MFSAFTDFDGYFECLDLQNIDGTNKFVGPSLSPLDDPMFVAFDRDFNLQDGHICC